MKYKTKKKRILFDLNHPADYHFFKNLFAQLQQEKYLIDVIARNKDCLQDLLVNAGIPFINRGKGSNSTTGKYIYGIYNLLLILISIIKKRPELTVSLSSPYLVIGSRIMGIPCITYDDTDNNPRLRPMLSHSTYVFSPSTYPDKFNTQHYHLEAFKELAYLHPKYFQKTEIGDGLFFRITKTDSIHHSSCSKLDIELIINRVNMISKNYSTWLSSEIDLQDLSIHKEVQIPDVLNIHKVLQSNKVFWGNSATMAAEAAVLGIPSIFVSGEKFSYIQELESYGLLFYYTPDQIDVSFKKLEQLLNDPSREHFNQSRNKLLEEKIDITSFLAWFIKNLPESADIISFNPEYHHKFIC